MLLDQLKALSDETRVRIVTILRHYELTVNELVGVLDMGQSRISRHLKILSDSKLVTSRREGLFVYYTYTKNEDSSIIEDLGRRLDEETQTEDLDSCEKELVKRKEKTREFFDEIAHNWGELKKEILGDFDLIEVVKEVISRYDCHTIADLGCGNGDLAFELADICEHLIGVDYSLQMLEAAKSRFGGRRHVPDFRIGDIEHLPMSDGEADCAIMNLVLHHMPKPAYAVREVSRVLGEEGIFLLLEFDVHSNSMLCSRLGDRWAGFSKDELDQWISDAGFIVVNYTLVHVKQELNVHIYYSKKSKE